MGTEIVVGAFPKIPVHPVWHTSEFSQSMNSFQKSLIN